jgi:hypothetical protein
VRPQLFYGQGQLRPLPTDQQAPVQGVGPATIAPGQTATLSVVISHACDTAQLSYDGIVLVQAGKQIAVPGLQLTGTCPTVHVGAWQPPQRPDPIPPRLQYGTLRALVDAPATAHAGDPIDYVVTLTNPGPATVAFSPCAVYRESIYKLSLTYLLNCPPAGLAPGDSIRFALRITASAYTPAGPTTIRWTIVEPGGESATASAPIEITQPS